MPNFGDIIIIHSVQVCGPYMARRGVRIRLDRARDKGDFRFTEVDTGRSTDGFKWSLRFADWTVAA